MYRSKLALGTAIVAGLAATQIASAEGPSPRATTAQAGLSVTPAIFESTARSGASGTATVTNSTGRKLRMTVRARPWRQSSRTGDVAADRRRTLGGVSLSASSFTLDAGAHAEHQRDAQARAVAALPVRRARRRRQAHQAAQGHQRHLPARLEPALQPDRRRSQAAAERGGRARVGQGLETHARASGPQRGEHGRSGRRQREHHRRARRTQRWDHARADPARQVRRRHPGLAQRPERRARTAHRSR